MVTALAVWQGVLEAALINAFMVAVHPLASQAAVYKIAFDRPALRGCELPIAAEAVAAQLANIAVAFQIADGNLAAEAAVQQMLAAAIQVTLLIGGRHQLTSWVERGE